MVLFLSLAVGFEQGPTDTPLELFAARENVDVQHVESSARDFNPGIFLVIGTPHRGSRQGIIAFDLVNGSFELLAQPEPPSEPKSLPKPDHGIKGNRERWPASSAPKSPVFSGRCANTMG
jgi:hypothetical protein